MIVINQSVSECEEGEKDKHANGNLQLPVVSKSNGELSPCFFKTLLYNVPHFCFYQTSVQSLH